MRIIKLDAIDSTNSYLKKLQNEEPLEDYTVVVARHQTHGRGQLGGVWESEMDKNLMFTVFKDIANLNLSHPFFISIATSLAMVKSLQRFSILKLNVKWPNDILSDDKKICGILIENIFKQGQINSSIIGVGLNVNQADFNDLPKASSLKLITGRIFDLDELLQEILKNLKAYFDILERKHFDLLISQYEELLFRKDKPSTFRDNKGVLFSGIIKGVSLSGSLNVLLEDNVIKAFDLKEITLLY